MAVTPIHRAKTVKRMVVSTYQAASGAGQAAMDELVAQTRAVLDGTDLPMEIFPFQYAFNLFSHNAPMMDNGYNEEVRLLFRQLQLFGFEAAIRKLHRMT
jgi:aspartate-semialdehyde dehydrogenase